MLYNIIYSSLKPNVLCRALGPAEPEGCIIAKNKKPLHLHHPPFCEVSRLCRAGIKPNRLRVNSLICIGKLLEHMDKWQVIDDVLPALPQIPSKEPAVIMAIVGIYKLAFSNSKLGLTKEVMANKVLPFLIPLSIENGLTVAQYNSVTSLIREMMTRVETEHRTKLEQLNSIQEDGKATMASACNSLSPGQLVAAPTAHEVSSYIGCRFYC